MRDIIGFCIGRAFNSGNQPMDIALVEYLSWFLADNHTKPQHARRLIVHTRAAPTPDECKTADLDLLQVYLHM